MVEHESYVTKTDPSVEDWLAYNEGLFALLRGEASDVDPQYAPLTDVDKHAAKAGVSVEEYFNLIKERVGPLGRVALQLVYSEMDEAWHIVVEVVDEA